MKFRQRYRIFFFRGKVWGVLTHSLWALFVFFFSVFWKKKKQAVFFFPGKVCKPLTQLRDGKPPKKGQKRTKTAPFVEFQIFSLLFFFPKIWIKILFFFFPGKVHTPLTHSISEGGKKKTAPEKKKHNFYSLTRFFTKSCKF